MKPDTSTKILLLTIAIFLGIIALRPLVQTETAQASPGGFDHVRYVGGFGPAFLLMDTRNGNVWGYEVSTRSGEKPKPTFFAGRLIELGQPLAMEKK